MKRKPRVLFDSFHLTNALTGIRTYSTELFRGIEELEQDEVDYIFSPNWKAINRNDFLRGKVGILKKIVNHFLYFSWKQVILPWIILFSRVDVVVAIDYMLPYVRFGAKGVAVFHDTFYWDLKKNYNPVWRQFFIFLVRKGLGVNPLIITTTNHVSNKVRGVLSNDYLIKVVYQCPKEIKMEKRSEEYLEQLGLNKRINYFLHVGVFDERKNLEILVQGFYHFQQKYPQENFMLVLAGSPAVTLFHDSYNQIITLIKEFGIEDQVQLPGFVSDDQLFELYLNAFAYVFPSKEEGFGIPILEAMKMKVPVIISDQAALKEVAGEAALSFNMNDSKDLFNQMEKLKKSEFRDQMIEKGKKRVEQFSRIKFAADFHKSILDYSYNH